MMVLALAALAGCAADQGAAVPEAALPQVADDLRSAPCTAVTRDMVSAAFSIDAALIEQSSMSSLCVYRWEGEEELLDVTVHVTAVAPDERQARALFEDATSGEGARSSSPEAGPFEDVDDIGDQARFDTANSDLHVLRDRVYFTLNAYFGPAMEPVESSSDAANAIDARTQWWQATLPQRRQTTQTLASVWMGDDTRR
ncbi:hypothetical protein [Lysobacter sp. A03]|uniref:hypothetical protein n=1 Tax=Lysobacter sp. A03 TaxID=1199154 RepID=UPI00126A0230|nr:hypothetical protein [Lysobacter sp. A03]